MSITELLATSNQALQHAEGAGIEAQRHHVADGRRRLWLAVQQAWLVVARRPELPAALDHARDLEATALLTRSWRKS